MRVLPTPLCRLAVLPPTGAKQDDYFARGFVEDLITDFSRFSTLGVISHHSTFATQLEGKADDEISIALGSDFHLKTSIRRHGNVVRINAQLIDPQSGGILWAERYDSPEDQILNLQDSMVEKIVSTLSQKIDSTLLEAARRKPISELETYDCWLRGTEKLREGSIEANEAAREIFEHALDLDPHCARAYVGLSLSHFNEWSCQNWNMSEISECRSYQHATRALQLDPSDHVAHHVAGRVLLYRGEFQKCAAHMEKAYELNPNDADQLVLVASCNAFLGETGTAAELFDRALSLNPLCDSWYFAFGGFIKIMRREFEEGVAMALKAPLTSVWIDLSGFIAIAYAYLGNEKEAAEYSRIFMQAFQEKVIDGRVPKPGEAYRWLREVNPFAKEKDAEFYHQGLLLAGLSDAPSSETPAPTPVSSASSTPVFRVDHPLRTMIFDGQQAQLPEVKGFKDIARLLRAEGEEIHCTELMGIVSETGEADEVMDARARRDCAVRIRELQADLAEAEEADDPARAEQIHTELDPLLDHLAKAAGIGGRSRKLAAPAERARSAVTLRIRSAIRKIEPTHPALARHFSRSIRTGTFCSYAPEIPVNWML